MNLNRRFVLALFGCVPLLSAATSFAAGQTFMPVADQAPNETIVYVFRAPSFTGAAAAMRFVVDGGTTQYSLKNGRYLVLRLAPGEHTIRQVGSAWGLKDLKLAPVTLTTEAGQHYYVKFTILLAGVDVGTSTVTVAGNVIFAQVDEATALPEISKTRAN
jgi:hypothetical protein